METTTEESMIFSQTHRTIVSKTTIKSEEAEVLAYAFLGYKSDKEEDNQFVLDCLINGWFSKEDYIILVGKYPSLFYKPVDSVFGPSELISNGTLLSDVIDISDARNSLARLRESQKPDYWDELAKIKKKKRGKWFHMSH